MRTNLPLTFTNHSANNRNKVSMHDGIGSRASQMLQCLLLITALVSPSYLSGFSIPSVLKVPSFTNSFLSPHSSSSRILPIMTRSHRREGWSSSPWMLNSPICRRRMDAIYFKEEDNSEEDSVTESSLRQRDSDSRIQTMETVDAEKILRQKHDLREEEPILWRVLLHNDHIHTFSYVVQSIVKVVGILTRAQAWEVVVHAHANDRATICKVWKSKAEQFCLGLQRQGLTASIVPEYEFNYYDYLRHQLGSTTKNKQLDRQKIKNNKDG